MRPYLSPDRASEIIEAITDLDQTFSCHKHNEFSEDEDGHSVAIEPRTAQHCAGAMILLERMGQPNQWMRIAERMGWYRRDRLRMDAPVYADDQAMLAAYQAADDA